MSDKGWSWTLTLGELRALDLPDDTQIVLHDGDLEFHEASVEKHLILPLVLEHPYCLALVAGQVINYELDLEARIDAVQGT